MPTRREVLFDGALALVFGGIGGCGCAHAASRKKRFTGCMLTDEQADALFHSEAVRRSTNHHGTETTLYANSGNADFDRALAHTLVMISDSFGVLPGFAYYDDSDGMNAFATPRVLLDRTDGTVLFGLRLLKAQLALPEHPEVAVNTVCAHEFGHVAQFKHGLTETLLAGQPTVKRLELHADFLAGYFAGLRKVEKTDFPAATFALTQYGVGDLAENNPGHHGTPDERGAAIVRGFEVAFKERRSFAEALDVGVAYVKTV